MERENIVLIGSVGGRGLTFYEPNEETVSINWGNVKPEIKTEFYKKWQNAYELVANDNNEGANYMCVLEDMAYLIDSKQVQYDATYEEIEEIAFNMFMETI